MPAERQPRGLAYVSQATDANSLTSLTIAPSTAIEYVTVRATGVLGRHALNPTANSGIVKRTSAIRRIASVDLADAAGLDLVHEPADAVPVEQQRRRSQPRHRSAHAASRGR